MRRVPWSFAALALGFSLGVSCEPVPCETRFEMGADECKEFGIEVMEGGTVKLGPMAKLTIKAKEIKTTSLVSVVIRRDGGMGEPAYVKPTTAGEVTVSLAKEKPQVKLGVRIYVDGFRSKEVSVMTKGVMEFGMAVAATKVVENNFNDQRTPQIYGQTVYSIMTRKNAVGEALHQQSKDKPATHSALAYTRKIGQVGERFGELQWDAMEKKLRFRHCPPNAIGQCLESTELFPSNGTPSDADNSHMGSLRNEPLAAFGYGLTIKAGVLTGEKFEFFKDMQTTTSSIRRLLLMKHINKLKILALTEKGFESFEYSPGMPPPMGSLVPEKADGGLHAQLSSAKLPHQQIKAWASEDLDKNGAFDLAYSTGTTICFAMGSKEGAFAAFDSSECINVGKEVSDLAIGDLNGDGWMDLAAVIDKQNDLQLFLQKPAPN